MVPRNSCVPRCVVISARKDRCRESEHNAAISHTVAASHTRQVAMASIRQRDIGGTPSELTTLRCEIKHEEAEEKAFERGGGRDY